MCNGPKNMSCLNCGKPLTDKDETFCVSGSVINRRYTCPACGANNSFHLSTSREWPPATLEVKAR